jgi:hypothetical protein
MESSYFIYGVVQGCRHALALTPTSRLDQTRTPSRPGGCTRAPHRSGLEPLDSHGSCHPMKLPPPIKTLEFLRLPVDPADPDAGDLLPSLRELRRLLSITQQSAHGWPIGTFGLAALPLVPFPLTEPTRFTSSVRKPRSDSRPLCTRHHRANK